MWDAIWAIFSAIIVKIGADAGEQGLIALARRIVQAQVNALPASQRESLGILADFEARSTTADKLSFAIQMVPAYVKLRALDYRERIPRAIRRYRWLYGGQSPFGNYLLLPVCKVKSHHTWKHYCNPALYYCRICGTQAPRWMGVHNGHGGYHCDLNVKP